MRVSFGLEELHAKICYAVSSVMSVNAIPNLHVKTGDSSSCTSLSICMSMLTDISKSALSLLASTFRGK
jgi:hypothetical protein